MKKNKGTSVYALLAYPELYGLTADDVHKIEQEEYIRRTLMTAAEKKALRKWIASGHSVHESPGSKYICDLDMDFLDVYRADHEIAKAIRGKTEEERIAFIKEYTGYTDPTPEELARMDAIKHTPVYVQRRYEALYRQISLLWDYIAEEGLLAEAKEYLQDHDGDTGFPMEFSFILE